MGDVSLEGGVAVVVEPVKKLNTDDFSPADGFSPPDMASSPIFEDGTSTGELEAGGQPDGLTAKETEELQLLYNLPDTTAAWLKTNTQGTSVSETARILRGFTDLARTKGKLLHISVNRKVIFQALQESLSSRSKDEAGRPVDLSGDEQAGITSFFQSMAEAWPEMLKADPPGCNETINRELDFLYTNHPEVIPLSLDLLKSSFREGLADKKGRELPVKYLKYFELARKHLTVGQAADVFTVILDRQPDFAPQDLAEALHSLVAIGSKNKPAEADQAALSETDMAACKGLLDKTSEKFPTLKVSIAGDQEECVRELGKMIGLNPTEIAPMAQGLLKQMLLEGVNPWVARSVIANSCPAEVAVPLLTSYVLEGDLSKYGMGGAGLIEAVDVNYTQAMIVWGSDGHPTKLNQAYTDFFQAMATKLTLSAKLGSDRVGDLQWAWDESTYIRYYLKTEMQALKNAMQAILHLPETEAEPSAA